MSDAQMMNATEFARKCGVCLQTVNNWVNSGRVVPAQTINGRKFFSWDNYAQVKMKEVKAATIKSFLGIIVEDDEVSLEQSKALFMGTMKNVLPSAHLILGVQDMLEKMDSDSGEEMKPEAKAAFHRNVMEAFCNAVGAMMRGIAFDVYTVLPDASVIPLQFFLDLMFDVEVDEGLWKMYSGLSNSAKYQPDGLRTSVRMKFMDMARRYGVSKNFDAMKVSLKGFYLKAAITLANEDDFSVDTSAPEAAKLYADFRKKTLSGSVNSAYNLIKQDGFFSVVSGVSCLSDEQMQRVVDSISLDMYSVIYLSSRSRLNPLLLSMIDTVVRGGRAQLIVADEVRQA